MIRSTNIRFNLDKPLHREAWQRLQAMDKARLRSYSNAVMLALVDYLGRQERLQDDPYLETREREERFVAQIVEAVKQAMEKALPLLLSGCVAGMTTRLPPMPQQSDEPKNDPSEADVDWDFLKG